MIRVSDILSLTEFHRHSREHIEQLRATGHPKVLTVNGRAELIVQDAAAYQRLREIAEEAGTAKPKIYRHFHDKSDLFEAIGERLRDMLWAAIFPSIDLKTDSAREVIRRSVEEYVILVDKHPNVLRVFIQGRSAATSQVLNEGRGITLAVADMFDNELREMELDHAAVELAGHAAFGCAASATEWWLGPDPESPRLMSREQFVAHLTTIMMGVIVGTAEALSITMNPDLPIHDMVAGNPAAS